MALNILFVSQDDAFTFDMIGLSLHTDMSEHPEIKVFGAQNEQDAYKVLNNRPVHMMVVDYDIKNMNCDRFVDLIKIDQRFRRIPIAIISADKFNERRAYEIGIVDFFHKPISIQELIDKISSTLSPFHEVNHILHPVDIETTEALLALLKQNIKYNSFLKTSLQDDISKLNVEKLIEVCNSMARNNQKVINHINDAKEGQN